MSKLALLGKTLHLFQITMSHVEGEWDDVMAAVKQCHEKLHDMGAPRISSSMKMGTRTDRVQTMQDKIDSVHLKMGD